MNTMSRGNTALQYDLEFLKMRVADTDLPRYTKQALLNNAIHTIGCLMLLTEDDFRRLSSFGNATISNIKELLRSKGYTLRPADTKLVDHAVSMFRDLRDAPALVLIEATRSEIDAQTAYNLKRRFGAASIGRVAEGGTEKLFGDILHVHRNNSEQKSKAAVRSIEVFLAKYDIALAA